MTSGANQNSILVFFVTMSLILLLALGVYASNRLLTQWLIVQSMDQTISQVPAALEKAGLSQDASNNAASPGSSLPDDLPLRRSINTVIVGAPAWVLGQDGNSLSGLAWDVISAELKPGQLLAGHYARQRLNGPDLLLSARAIQAALQQAMRPVTAHMVSAEAIGKALKALPGQSKPYTQVDMSWRGQINPNVLVVLPQFRPDGSAMGALFLISQQRDLIENLSGITAFSSGLITALCSLSILVAATLFWMRFRDRMHTTRNMEYLAHHDTLTGLPNRAVFNARLNESLRLSQAQAGNLGVMLIDVDRFKEINDTFGHGTGDLFLQIIAGRLKSVFSDHFVARLSGDEFAVMTSISDVAGLTKLASDMIAATSHPSVVNGKDIRFSLSIGIARASDANWRASRLLHCADLALYCAKHSGRSTFIWYSPEMDADAKKRKDIESGLIKALKFDQFELVFQPQYALADNQLKGYESLIRWNHPRKGVVSPDVFIPVAEETGLIEPIGDWVLTQACKEAASWPDPDLRIAVNVSAAQFTAGEIPTKVAQALRETGLDPGRLEIEITESLLISDPDAVVETLQQIRNMGVSIAMDDFGTGYSSLSYLSRFPFDKVKIDRSFIKSLGYEASTDAVVASIIGLGRSLNIVITAEGVETPEQATLLRAAGCDLVQGFLYGRPGPVTPQDRHKARLHLAQAQDTQTDRTLPDPGRPRPPEVKAGAGNAIEALQADGADLHAQALKDENAEPRAASG